MAGHKSSAWSMGSKVLSWLRRVRNSRGSAGTQDRSVTGPGYLWKVARPTKCAPLTATVECAARIFPLPSSGRERKEEVLWTAHLTSSLKDSAGGCR